MKRHSGKHERYCFKVALIKAQIESLVIYCKNNSKKHNKYRRNLNPLSAKFIKWSNTLKQIVGKLPTICLSVFDHFSGLALKGLSLYF